MTLKGRRQMDVDSEERSDEEFLPSDKGNERGTNGYNLTDSNIVSSESDFDDTRICNKDESGVRRFEFNRKNMFDEPKLELGMYFACKSDFATVVRSVAVKQRRSVKLTKNDARRVYAKCKDTSCDWGIHLVKIKNEESWKVNEYYHNHTCKPSYNCSSVKTGWLAEKYIDSLKSDPNKGVEAFRKEMVKELECHVSRTQAHEVKKKALKLLAGNHLDQLSLPWYYNKEVSPNSDTAMVMGTVECDDSKVKRRGRPTKKRRLELWEPPMNHAKGDAGRPKSKEQYRTKRQQKTVTCKMCGEQGHNKARCSRRIQGGDKGKAPMIEERVDNASALVIYTPSVEEEAALLNSNKDSCEKSSDEGATQIAEDDLDKDQSGGSTTNDVEDKKEAVPAQSESDRLRLILSVVDQMKEADSLIKVKSLVALTSRTLQKFIEKENNKVVGNDDENLEAVEHKPRVREHVTIRVGKAVCNDNKVETGVDIQMMNTKKSTIVLSTVEQKEKKTKKRKIVDDALKRSGDDVVRGLDTCSGWGNSLSAKQPSRFKVLEIANNFNKTPLIIPFSINIFGLEYNEQIDTKVVNDFLREKPCSPSAMAMYIRYTYESAIIQFNLRRKFAFLSPKEMYIPSPCMTNKNLLDERMTLASEYVARVMCTMLEKEGLLLVPLEVGDHWILIAINPGKMKVYLCDPNECFQSDHHIQFTIMYRALAIVRSKDESAESLYKKFKPVNVKVPRHKKGDQSGMCVMRYIKEIVHHRVTSIPPDFYPDCCCFRYDKGELDDITEEWSSYIIKLTM